MCKDKGLQLVMLPTDNKENELRGYSRSDVEELCGKAFNAGEAYRTGSCDLFKQIHPDKHEWIKKNLK